MSVNLRVAFPSDASAIHALIAGNLEVGHDLHKGPDYVHFQQGNSGLLQLPFKVCPDFFPQGLGASVCNTEALHKPLIHFWQSRL